jgi:DNA polymerase III sliding clamp (beta) subunit (PCNA family)
LYIKHEHTSAGLDKKTVRVGKRLSVVQSTNDEISLSFEVAISHSSMMDLMKIVQDKDDNGSLTIEVSKADSQYLCVDFKLALDAVREISTD